MSAIESSLNQSGASTREIAGSHGKAIFTPGSWVSLQFATKDISCIDRDAVILIRSLTKYPIPSIVVCTSFLLHIHLTVYCSIESVNVRPFSEDEGYRSEKYVTIMQTTTSWDSGILELRLYTPSYRLTSPLLAWEVLPHLTLTNGQEIRISYRQAHDQPL